MSALARLLPVPFDGGAPISVKFSTFAASVKVTALLELWVPAPATSKSWSPTKGGEDCVGGGPKAVVLLWRGWGMAVAPAGCGHE